MSTLSTPALTTPSTENTVPSHIPVAGFLTSFRYLLKCHLQKSFCNRSILKDSLLTILSLLYFPSCHLVPCDILLFYWLITNCGPPPSEGEFLETWGLLLLSSLLYPWNSLWNWLVKYLMNEWMNEHSSCFEETTFILVNPPFNKPSRLILSMIYLNNMI